MVFGVCFWGFCSHLALSSRSPTTAMAAVGDQDPKFQTMGQHMTAPMATDGNGWTLANVETSNTFDLTTYQNVTDMTLIVFSEPSELSTISSIWFLFLLIQTDSKVMWFPSMNLTFDTTVFHWPCFSHLPHTLCIMHVPEMEHFFAPITRTAKPRPANISDFRRDFYATRRGERCGSTHPTAWLSVAKCSHVGWHVGTRGTSWGYWSPCCGVGVWRFFSGSDGSKNLLVTLVSICVSKWYSIEDWSWLSCSDCSDIGLGAEAFQDAFKLCSWKQ